MYNSPITLNIFKSVENISVLDRTKTEPRNVCYNYLLSREALTNEMPGKENKVS